MNEFLQRIDDGVTRRCLLPRGQKILVAVSGGADSMVLLHAMNALAPKNQWKISIAHLNHRLRGRASDADEKLVCATAGKLSLPFFSERADVADFARRSKISVEMAARKLRHEFLARTARRQKIPVVALAHHADDQVELFFLRLLRGAGGEGLAGMKWRSPSPVDKTLSLVRLLLAFSKTELLAFAREQKIPFRDDATNFSADFLRNRIRTELLPLLREKYQPALSRTVLRLMDIVGAEADFVSEVAQKVVSSQWPGPVRPQAERYIFARLPVAVQRKMLQQQLNRLGLLSDFDLIEQLRTSAGKFVSVNSDLAIARNADGILACREPHDPKFNSGELRLKLAGRAGRAEFGGSKFSWSVKKSAGSRGRLPHGENAESGKWKAESGQEFFDAEKTGGEIILRHWRAGDRFQPIGLKSSAKLQDLFVNAKMPAARRRKLVLATTVAGEIFWVAGLRIGEGFKLVPETRRVLAWNCSKIAA